MACSDHRFRAHFSSVGIKADATHLMEVSTDYSVFPAIVDVAVGTHTQKADNVDHEHITVSR